MPKAWTPDQELRRISEVLTRLAAKADASAKTIRSTTDAKGVPLAEPLPPPSPRERPDDDLELVEALFAERRRRDSFFTGYRTLLGEPAWDILLYLYIGRKRGWAISVSHASRASGAAPTSALRCIARLEDGDLVRRSHDEFDKRRTLVDLTDSGATLMEDYIGSLRPPH